MKLIERNLAQIVALCKKHKVVALYVFGSALTNKFNKDSDVDFSVIFDRDSLPLMKYGDNYFNFKFALEDLLHRDVDLIEYNRSGIRTSKKNLTRHGCTTPRRRWREITKFS